MINQKLLIGSTKLLPYKVNKDKIYLEYLKFILLSYEYLEKSQFLTYRKRHPRIHPLYLLNIKIPLPDLDIQEKIISEIQKQGKNEEAKQKLNDYRKQIKDLIFKYPMNKEENKMIKNRDMQDSLSVFTGPPIEVTNKRVCGSFLWCVSKFGSHGGFHIHVALSKNVGNRLTKLMKSEGRLIVL